MDDVLGHPEHDPHGDPIPDAAGRVARDTSHALADVAAGTDVRVTRVSDRSPEILRHLEGVGIGIGTILTVAGVSLEAGAVSVVVVGGVSVQLGLPTAAAVRVAPEPAA
jgi:DtxR family Mn-dependent transcriptional regulator